MLKDKKNDLMHLLTMLESLEKVRLFSEGAEDAEAFYELNEQLNLNAVLNLLVHLGETVGKLSDDLLQAASDIEWSKIKKQRNRIAHDYPGLDTLLIFQIVRNDVPILLQQLYQITHKRIVAGVFDPEELNVAYGSHFYRHVQFSLLVEENRGQ